MKDEKWEIEWSEEFVCGNEVIDNYHKVIIDSVKDLYEMFHDTKKHTKEIPETTKKIEEAIIEHMDYEIDLAKKYDIPDWKKHEASHKYYQNCLNLYSKYYIPPTIKGIMIAEITRNYMKTHFIKYDVKDIEKINEMIKENHE